MLARYPAVAPWDEDLSASADSRLGQSSAIKHSKELCLACRYVRQGIRIGVDLDDTGQEVDKRLTATAVRHVHEIEAGVDLEYLGHEMAKRAHTGGAPAQLTWVPL
jgi:hypothetical protein